MNHRSFVRPFAPLALLVLVSSAAPRAGVVRTQEEGGPVVLSLSEIVLDQYQVQSVDADELFVLANELVGRGYWLKENGGTSSDALSSLRQLGDSIVLYDTKERVQRARELLARLDVARPESRAQKTAVEFRPRFVSLRTAEAAVEAFVGVSMVEERGLIVLNSRPEQVDAALALLKRIDAPEKQVLITCQLVEVGGAQQGPPLTKELVDNLQKLLPGNLFAQTGMAMLKASVSGKSHISLQLDTASRTYLLTFKPVSFDEASGALTITDCMLSEDGRQLFRTNTVLRGGEYTVLAATGATAQLLVVRVTPQD